MFFQQNIDAIALKNKPLADKLSEIYLVEVEENIEIYTSETGDYVFSYDGLVLDDMLNPKDYEKLNCEENIPSDFNNSDVIVVFGLGTGYLLDFICKNYTSNIVFIEPKLEILRYAIEFVDFTEEFSDPRVHIAANFEEALKQTNALMKGENSRLTVVYPAAYEQLVPEDLDTILSKMTDLAIDLSE
ncbi:MAG: hypothetical protein K6A44_03615 [bacterium]|nr:hypothetical protein [bacterium]